MEEALSVHGGIGMIGSSMDRSPKTLDRSAGQSAHDADPPPLHHQPLFFSLRVTPHIFSSTMPLAMAAPPRGLAFMCVTEWALFHCCSVVVMGQ